MDAFLSDPSAMKEIGFFWVFVACVVSACVYFGPTVKSLIKSIPSRQNESNQIVDNCTEALHLCRAALDNNTEALRDNKKDRDTNTAILIEHDRKSEIRFEHQNETLARIETKI